MIMFFQMFKNSMYICCSVRGKIMLLRNNKTSLRLFYSILQKTTWKDVILDFLVYIFFFGKNCMICAKTFFELFFIKKILFGKKDYNM